MDKELGAAGLADAIDALRLELMDAVNRGWNQPLQFKLAPIEITVQTVLTRGMEGKLGWSVLGLGAKAEVQNTHTLKLSIEPWMQGPDGAPVEVRVGDNESGDAIRRAQQSE